jgi:hypothetical protein
MLGLLFTVALIAVNLAVVIIGSHVPRLSKRLNSAQLNAGLARMDMLDSALAGIVGDQGPI